MGNTLYLGELEKATGLIFKYNKEKERELVHKKKYNKYKNNKDNNNNNNDNDNKDKDDGKNDDKTETVGAIVEDFKDTNKRTMEHILALVNAGYNNMTLFDRKMDKEEYLNKCETQLYEDGPVG